MESCQSYFLDRSERTTRIKIVVCGAACVLLFGALSNTNAQPRREDRRVRSYVGPNRHVMVIVRGGMFTMGSPLTEPGRPGSRVEKRK
jgi:hypothetical protein